MFKWIVGGLGVLLVAVLCLGLFVGSRLDRYVDENRPWISEQLEGAVGRPVRFGEVGISWRDLGVRVSDIAVGEDPAYGSEDFLKADEVGISVALWPALQGRYEVRRVAVRRAALRVLQDAKGMNIDSLMESGADAGAAPAATDAEDLGALAGLLVAYVDLEDAEVRYEDRTGASPVGWTLRDLDFRARDVADGSIVPIELQADVGGVGRQNLSLTGTVGPVSFADPAKAPLELELAFGPIDPATVEKLAQGPAALPAELSLAGAFDVAAKLTGAAAMPIAELRFEAGPAGIVFGDTFTKIEGAPMRLSLRAISEADAVRIEGLELALGEAVLTGEGSVRSDEAGGYSLTLRGKDVPLSGWDSFAPSLAGTELLGRADLDLKVDSAGTAEALPALTGVLSLRDAGLRMPDTPEIRGLDSKIRFEGDRVRIPKSELSIGGSQAVIEATVTRLSAPVVDFGLTSSAVPLEALGVADPEGQRTEVLRGVKLAGQARSVEGGMDVDASLTSADGVLRDIDYRALEARVTVRGTETRIEQLEFQAFEGTIATTGRYDTKDPGEPVFSGTTSFSNVSVAPLAQALGAGGAAGMLEGVLVGDLVVDGSGLEWEQISQALQGNGNLRVEEGRLKDVNLAEGVLSGLTGVAGLSNLLSNDLRQSHPKLFGTADTEFRRLATKFKIEQGRMVLPDLGIEASDYGIEGAGSLGLDGSIDLSGTLVASSGLTQSLVKAIGPMKYLKGSDGKIEIPFTASGAASSPSVKVDSAFVQKSLRKAAVGGALDFLGIRAKPPAGKAPGGAPAPGAPLDASGDAPVDVPEQAPGEASAEAPEPASEETPEDALRDAVGKGLQDLFRR